jgi:histone deacetylase HOS3
MALKKSAIFLQNACLQHRYIRSQDLSNIVERPERLRAVNIGLAAAISHLEDLLPDASGNNNTTTPPDPNDLAAALNKMTLESESKSLKIPVIQSEAKVDILQNPAVKFIHGDIDGDVYLETLQEWVKQSLDKIIEGESEIPEGYSQGDLYCTTKLSNAFIALEI